MFGDMPMLALLGALLSFFVLFTSNTDTNKNRVNALTAATREALPSYRLPIARNQEQSELYPAAQHLLWDIPGARMLLDPLGGPIAIVPLSALFDEGTPNVAPRARVIAERIRDITSESAGEIALIPSTKQSALDQVNDLYDRVLALEKAAIFDPRRVSWRIVLESEYSAEHQLLLFRKLPRNSDGGENHG